MISFSVSLSLVPRLSLLAVSRQKEITIKMGPICAASATILRAFKSIATRKMFISFGQWTANWFLFSVSSAIFIHPMWERSRATQFIVLQPSLFLTSCCYVSNEDVIRERTMTFRLITLMENHLFTERMELQQFFSVKWKLFFSAANWNECEMENGASIIWKWPIQQSNKICHQVERLLWSCFTRFLVVNQTTRCCWALLLTAVQICL